MVSFRFHLVSLVAVFLALGLGVLTGTTVLNRGIVTQLERQTDQLVAASNRLREDLRELRSRNEGLSAFAGETAGMILDGRLEGEDVIVVTQEGTDADAINRVREGLESAGAEVAAVLSVGRRIWEPVAGDSSILARVGGVEAGDPAAGDPEAIASAVADALALRLVSRPGGSDPLAALLAEGFVANRGPGLGATALRELGGPRQVVAVVAGGRGEPLIPPEGFLVPLVQGLAERGARVAAAEGVRTDYPFVPLLRANDLLSRAIVTQDNVDEVPGEVGFVVALESLIERNRPGHFGIKDGAEAVVPTLR